MNAPLSYLLMTIVSLGIVYVGYLVALRSETFFRLNRIYLLSGILISFLLPLAGSMGWLPDVASSLFLRERPNHSFLFGTIDIPALDAPVIHFLNDNGLSSNVSPVDNMNDNAPIGDVLPEDVSVGAVFADVLAVDDLPVVVQPAVSPLAQRDFITVADLLWALYLAVSLYLLVRFMVQLFGMWNLRRKAETRSCGGYSVCWVTDDVVPFSFFSTIFLSKSIENEDQLNDIVCHEAVHIRERHSLDIMVLQWLKVFFWFNPFLYLMDRSLRESHEFLVDARVLEQGLDVDAYETLLLRHLGGTQALVLSNNFNYSIIKRRLSMITRKSRRWAWYKSALMIPLALSMVCLFSLNSSAREVSGSEMMSGTILEVASLQEPPIVKEPAGIKKVEEAEKETPKNKALLLVDHMPQFPGGSSALSAYLVKNLRYPLAAKDAGIQGQVVLSFVIEADGAITHLSVLRSLNPDCDAEALRVVSMMPKWEPGTKNGEKVPIQFVMPVRFRLMSSPQMELAPSNEAASMFMQKQMALADAQQRLLQVQGQSNPLAEQAGSVPLKKDVNLFLQKQRTLADAQQRLLQVQGQSKTPVVQLPQNSQTLQMPQFPGGSNALSAFIAKNLRYPLAAKDSSIKGYVLINFLVEADGTITNPRVLRSLHPDCDAEALRVVNMMPKWEPGTKNGEKIRTMFVIPIQFQLR